MKASNNIVREGVSCRYLFHTCMTISCGDERGDNVELGAVDLTGTAGFEDIEPAGLCTAAGGGFDAATEAGVFVAGD